MRLHSETTGKNTLTVNNIQVLNGSYPTLDLEGMSASGEIDSDLGELIYQIDMLDGDELKLYGTIGGQNITADYANRVVDGQSRPDEQSA